MKIVASDFDGTIYSRELGITKEDQESIRRWQAAGNKFGLATGRNYTMAVGGAGDFGIKLDFCVAMNGAAIYDGEGNELYGVHMKKELFQRLLCHSALKDSPYVGILQGKGAFIEVRDAENPVLQGWKAGGAVEVTHEEAMELPNVVQVCIDTEDHEKAVRCAEEINRDFEGELIAVANRIFVDICMVGNDKGTGVTKLVHAMDWKDDDIFVIGDDCNDIPMIERFDGFTVASGNAAVKPVASRVYESVGEMLQEKMQEVSV